MYRCRVCKKRIPKRIVTQALLCKKEPAYCGPAHRKTWKKRVQRANQKAAACPSP